MRHWSQLQLSSKQLFELAPMRPRNPMRFGNCLECHKSIILSLHSVDNLVALFTGMTLFAEKRVDSLSFGVNSVTEKLDFLGVVVNGVLLHTSESKETSFSNHRSFLCHFPSLQILYKMLFELLHSFIMIVDHFWKIFKSSTNASTVDWRTDLDTIHFEKSHKRQQTGVTAEIFADMSDLQERVNELITERKKCYAKRYHERSRIDLGLICRRSKPSFSQSNLRRLVRNDKQPSFIIDVPLISSWARLRAKVSNGNLFFCFKKTAH